MGTRIEGDKRVTNPHESWITLEVTPLVDRETWDTAQDRTISNEKLAHSVYAKG